MTVSCLPCRKNRISLSLATACYYEKCHFIYAMNGVRSMLKLIGQSTKDKQ